jgi:hypothetical protein
MARQTSVNGAGATRPDGMLEGVSSFGSNVLTLTVLQARLVGHELREMSNQALPGLVTLAVSCLVALAGTVVGLAGIGLWIGQSLSLSPATGMLLTAIGAVCLSTLVAVLAVRRIRSWLGLRRSAEELKRNLDWLNMILARGGR